jgi:CubicO group peptidase (beta-lactamase class C family)
MTGTSIRRAVALVVFLAASACDGSAGPDGYQKPAQTNDGWATASPEQVGMDPQPLLGLLDLVAHTEGHLFHGLLIVRNQRLVLEEYWRGTDLEPGTLAPVERDFDRNTLHYVASVSKSITSALAGIAIDQARLGGVEDSVFSYFPDYAGLQTDDNGGITVRHLLAFSSGYDWNEFVYGFDDPRDSHYQMFATPDPIGYLFARPMVSDPGAEFRYNSGDTNLLGEIVRRTSSSATLVDYADRYLFAPLGITTYEWLRFPRAAGITFASGGVSLRPRDMAKLGAVYLDGGVWNGTRIVSQGWVDASTALSTPLSGTYRSAYGYGYNWWLGRSQYRGGTVEYFRASGWGGQEVFVYPQLALIVVFTAGRYYDTSPLRVDDLLEQYILPAIVD